MLDEAAFEDRVDAGKKLAKLLLPYRNLEPIVLGMPRGGVVLAYEIAKLLHAPLDVIIARKIGAPTQPEYAIGAIAPGDIKVLNSQAITALGITEAEIKTIIATEKKELARRIKLFRGSRSEIQVKDRVVIVVDDGIATGLSAVAALRSLRKLEPKKIIMSAAVCARDSVAMLQHEADEIICLIMAEYFVAVSRWFRDFEQTTDQQVVQLLAQNQKDLELKGA